MDRTYPDSGPPHLASEYINRKRHFPKVMQALMDHWGHLLTTIVGGLGRRMMLTSLGIQYFLKGCKQEHFFLDQYIHIGEIAMPIMILANPLFPWLMKLQNGLLDSSKERFNQLLSRCRITMKCAFGRLKGQWRHLITRLDLSNLRGQRQNVTSRVEKRNGKIFCCF